MVLDERGSAARGGRTARQARIAILAGACAFRGRVAVAGHDPLDVHRTPSVSSCGPAAEPCPCQRRASGEGRQT